MAASITLSLLLLEDSLEDQEKFYTILQQENIHRLAFKIHSVSTLPEALEWLSQGTTDLIITKLFAPEKEGIKTFIQLYKQIRERVPILVSVTHQHESLAIESMREGAQDYVEKGAALPYTLLHTIRYSLERHRMQHYLKTLSLTDALTGLYNRRGFVNTIHQHLQTFKRLEKGLLFFLIDLDFLKEINDTFGHLEGDKALRQIALCLKENFRLSDIVARIGGDEFAAVALDVGPDESEKFKEKLFNSLENYNKEASKEYRLSFSLGIAYFDPASPCSLEELMERADQDLYRQKKRLHSKL